MQGFNKYYPPDYDPSHGSLNSYHGKHALGARAHKIDQGILVVRFEIPFNIWCGTCENHIGMGVRFNAEKKKIGTYFSTPIFSFRCKCHLCDGHFVLETDPKNTRYVVTSGARQKDEEWDPAENGGFAIHDSEASATPADPLAVLEKATDAKNHLTKVQMPRIESLQEVSDHFNSDPYALSKKIRKSFREEKKVELKRKEADDTLKSKFGLPEDLRLDQDNEDTIQEAKAEWIKAQRDLESQRSAKRRKITAMGGQLDSSTQRSSASVVPRIRARLGSSGASSAPNPVVNALRARILENTARQRVPKR